MGVYEGRGSLSKALKNLENSWLETKSAWTDAPSREFEKRFLEPLHADVRSAVSAMDQMAVLISKVRHECE